MFVSLYGLFADRATAAEQARNLASVLPPDAAGFLYDEMTRVAAAPAGRLGLAGLISFVVVLWGANRSMKAMIEALNVAYGERETRSLLRVNLEALGFTLGFVVFGLLSVVLVVAVPPLLDAIRLGPVLEPALSLARWPLLFGGMMIGTALLYRYGPDRTPPKLIWVTPGSIAAGVLWLLASSLISWYAGSFADFDKTYGSLGAVVVLQTWIWVTALVVITGAKINAEAEHQTARDSTVGPPKPMGERGAVVADSCPPPPAA